MRLTNEMRIAFVKRVMKAVKMKSKWDEAKITEEIGKRLNMSLPQEVQDFAKKYPHCLMMVSSYIKFMEHRKTNKENGHTWRVSPTAPHINGAKLTDIDTSDLQVEWEKYRAELAKREEMEDRLLQQSKSVNTVEDLMVLFPKLKKHISQPVIEKKSLPVAQKGLMDELVKMGLEV